MTFERFDEPERFSPPSPYQTLEGADTFVALDGEQPVHAAMARDDVRPVTAPTLDGFASSTARTTSTQAKMESNMDKVMKSAEEMVSFGQGNVEALMKSGQIWAAGVQDIGKHFAETAQAQFDETLSTFKAFAGIKSVKEALELQSSFARSGMEKAVTATGKITDASMKLAEQTIAPLTARVSLAVERLGRTA